MTNKTVRRILPTRSSVSAKTRYRDYKPDLRKDFQQSCGYCDAPDWLFGGVRGFQIDHFAPKKRFPEYELSYSNLVYSCPICNRAKWDKWIGDDAEIPNDGIRGFVDPCDEYYDQQLGRTEEQEIIALTSMGAYMRKELKLNLIRHQFIGQVHKLNELKHRIRQIIPKLPADSDSVEIRKLFLDYIDLETRIEKYITAIQD